MDSAELLEMARRCKELREKICSELKTDMPNNYEICCLAGIKKMYNPYPDETPFWVPSEIC
jgi:hypothetical protein